LAAAGWQNRPNAASSSSRGLAKTNGIRSIIEIGCGDWQIMGLVDLDGILTGNRAPSPSRMRKNRNI
jgi:hypothetical protein